MFTVIRTINNSNSAIKRSIRIRNVECMSIRFDSSRLWAPVYRCVRDCRYNSNRIRVNAAVRKSCSIRYAQQCSRHHIRSASKHTHSATVCYNWQQYTYTYNVRPSRADDRRLCVRNFSAMSALWCVCSCRNIV